MKAVPLLAQERKVAGKKVKKLREEGKIPATVYGKDFASRVLAVDLREFRKVWAQVGETGLVDLNINGKTTPVLVADVQKHPVNHQILHVQFHAVKLTDKIKAHAPVELTGESPKVASGEGLLLQILQEVEVESLPADLPEKIVADVSSLTEIGQQLAVGDLLRIPGVEILTPAEEIVVKLVSAVSQETQKETEEVAKEEAGSESGEVAAGEEKESSSEAQS